MSSKATKEQIQNIAGMLKEKITIADGKATIAEGTYVGCLPEGLDEKILKQVQDHNSVFYPAVTQAFGEVAIEAMKKDKKLDQVTLEVPLIGNDHFDVTMSRSKTFPNPAGGDPIQKWGVIGAQLVTQSARANRGDMNAVRDSLATMALEALGK